MATFDFRILLETVEGKKTSYMSQSFVDTSVDLVLSASQVYNRITGSVSCSYQNQIFFSGSDFNTSKTFKDNLLLSSSLVGGFNTGSIDFDATTTEYDRLLRYKFFGEKVCNTLGLPNNQWVYVDQVRFPSDDESNIFQGNIDVNTAFISDTLTFANNANIGSDVPFYIDTGSDRYIKFIDTRGTGNASLIFGYDKDTDSYEINASDDTEFNIRNLNNLTVGTITASIFHQETTTDIDVLNTTLAGVTTVSGALADEPILRVQGNISSSGALTASKLQVLETFNFGGGGNISGDVTVGGSITANEFITQIISTADGSNTFGNSIDDIQRLTGSVNITGSLNLPDDAQINLGDGNDLSLYHNGNHSIIEDSGTGNLILLTSLFQVKNAANNQTMIQSNQGGAVKLLHNNSQKFITNAGGIDITGNITASGNISSSGTILASGFKKNGSDVFVDISDNTNLVGGTGITLTDDTLSTTDSEIVHDNLSGFVPNEHIDHSGVEITAGAGLTGGGDITSTRDIAVGAGTGVTVNANDVAIGQDVATTANVQFNNITASGFISASGDGNHWLGGKLNLYSSTPGNQEIKFGGAARIQGNDAFIILDSDNQFVARADNKMNFNTPLFGLGGFDTNDTPSATLHISGAGDTRLFVEGNITASGNITAVSMSGDGSGITGVTGEWDGTLDGDGQITGSLVVTQNITSSGNITADGNISASGILNAKQLVFGEPQFSTPSTIKFNDINTLSSSKTAGLMWDFPNDDMFIYAHQSSSDQSRMVFEATDNLSDGMIFWFNDYRGPQYDGFPLFIQGDKLIVNNPVDRKAVYHKDQNHPSSSWNGGPAGGANNVDFYLIKSGSSTVSKANSLIFGDVSDSQVTINGHITASGNISSSGTIQSTGNISSDGTGTFNKLEIHNGTPTLVLKDTSDDDDHEIEFQDNSGNIDYRIHTSNDIFNVHAVSNTPIAFHTNDTERMRILNGGNVGIGTTTPTKALHIVSGSGTNLTPALKLQKEVDGDGSATGILLGAVNAGHSKGGIFFENKGISSGRGSLHFASNNTSDTSEATIADARMTIIDGGNVGIGTTSPTYELDVVGDIGVNQYIHHNDNDNTAINFTTDQIQLQTAGATGFTLDSSQRIGIGTTSPLSNLHIKDSNHTAFRIDSSGGANKDTTIRFTGSAQTWDAKQYAQGSVNDGQYGFHIVDVTNSKFPFSIQPNNASKTLVLSGSRVGIGTSSPQELLHIAGTSDPTLVIQNTGDNQANSGKISFREASATTERVNIRYDGADNKLIIDTEEVSNAFVVDRATGNIGIGTTSPQTLLHVVGNIRIEAGSNETQNIQFFESSVERARIEFDSSATNDFSLQTSDNSDALQDRLIIKTSQDATQIGIGTVNPTKALQVEGSISSSDAMFMTNNKSIQWPYTGVNSSIRAESGHLKYTTSHGDHIFRSGSTDLVIFDASTQRVGIGTTSPDYSLDVAGDVGIDKHIYHNGDGDTFFRFADAEDKITLSAGGSHLNFTQTGLGVGVTATEKFDVDGNIKARGNISSPTFFSGFAGSGFRIESGSDGKQSFTIDDLTVRGSMSVYELLIHQIRATNGSLFVSNTGKITSASLSSVSNHYSMSFDTGSGYGHSFQVGDLIRAQRFVPDTNGSGSQVFKSDLHIVSINGTGSAVGVLTGSDDPRPNYEYVRIGSTTTADRQGSIYLTADDDNAPFIDVVDELTAHSQFNTSGKTKVRMGKLSGIGTTTFGTLPGYGFYASGSAFLEGSINATSGEIGGFTINNTAISASNLFMKSSGQITGSNVLFDGGKIASWDINESNFSAIDSNGGISIDAGNKIITARTGSSSDTVRVKLGQISANTYGIQGKDSTGTTIFDLGEQGNTIAGFTFTDTELSSGNFKLNSDKESLQLGTVTDLAANGTDKGFFVSGSGGVFIGKEDGEFIKFDNEVLTISSSNISVEVSDLKITASQIDMTTTEFDLNANSGDLEISSENKQISLANGNIKLDGDSNSGDGHIKVGTLTGPTDTSTENTGLYARGNGKILLKASSSNFIRLGNDEVIIKSTNVDISGSSVEIQSPNVFLGAGNSNFISASDGKIEISSSNFHLKEGNITASNVDLSGKLTSTEGTIGGFTINDNKISSDNLVLSSSTTAGDLIISTSKFQVDGAGGLTASAADISGKITATSGEFTGTITSTEGTIGGFTLGANKLSSDNLVLSSSTTATDEIISASNFQVKASGQVTASNVLLSTADVSGKITTSDITADGGTIGGFTIGTNKLSSDNLVLSSSTTAGDFIISASNFNVKGNGELTASSVDLSGKITATSGEVGGFTVGDNLSATNFTLDPSGKRITLGSGTDIFIADGDDGIQLGHGTFASAPFSVTKAGVLKAESGTIGGWTLSDTTLANGTDIVLDSSNKRISINDTTFENEGIQLEHNSGNPRFHIGEGGNNATASFIKYEDSKVTFGSGVTLSWGASGGNGVNLINTNDWRITSGSSFSQTSDYPENYVPTGANINGIRKENVINEIIGPDSSSLVKAWGMMPDNLSGADGGWNTNWVPINNQKTYAFTEYIMFKSALTGSAYFGLYAGKDLNNNGIFDSGAGSEISGSFDGLGVIKVNNATHTNNPYFLGQSINSLAANDGVELNKWYFLVGYVHPHDTSNTTKFGGMYDVKTGAKVKSLDDYKFTPSSSVALHRTYHYYNTTGTNTNGNDGTIFQYVTQPGMYEVNGGEVDISNFIDIGTAIATGNYSGSQTFISEKNIFSPVIGGNDGFFNETFRVGASSTGIQITGSGDVPNIKSGDYVAGTSGFIIDTGSAEFNNVSVRGTISSSVGNIGGFTIGAEKLSAQNLEISSSGKIHLGAGITLDANTNSGQIQVGNRVQLNGNADAIIGGFAIGKDKISSDNLLLSSSTAADSFIISASNFNVKAGGQITASNIRTDGGTVGGFTIDETSISGGGLTLKSNGQLTGSAVSMSGTIVTDDLTATAGNIGGFQLLGGKLKNDSVAGTAIIIQTGSYQTDASATMEAIYLGAVPDSGHTPGNVIQFTENKFGLAHLYFNQDANLARTYFEIGHTQNKIAGFEFDEKTIFSGTEISMSSANGGSIKLSSDGATTGIDIDSTTGIIGHGDSTNKVFETHKGQFRFSEDTISTGGNTGGATYDGNNILSNIDGYGELQPEYDGDGTD